MRKLRGQDISSTYEQRTLLINTLVVRRGTTNPYRYIHKLEVNYILKHSTRSIIYLWQVLARFGVPLQILEVTRQFHDGM